MQTRSAKAKHLSSPTNSTMEAEKAVVVESVPSGDLKDKSVEKKSDEPLDGDIDLDLSPESAAVMVGLYPLPTVGEVVTHEKAIDHPAVALFSPSNAKSTSPLLSPATIANLNVPGPPALVRSTCGVTQFNTYSAVWPIDKDKSRYKVPVEVRRAPESPSRLVEEPAALLSSSIKSAPESPFTPVKSFAKLALTSPFNRETLKKSSSLSDLEKLPVMPNISIMGFAIPDITVVPPVARLPLENEGRDSDSASKTTPQRFGHSSRRFKRWTRSEDNLLSFAMDREIGPPHNWKLISTKYFRGTRSINQCKARWKNALCPDIDRSPFTPDEDKQIVYLQSKGLGFPEIAAHLPGRISEQIRDRFINYVDPSRKTTEWTAEEDDLLTKLQRHVGNKWTEISKLIPGRSENSIKNRWHNRKTKQRRAFRRMAVEKQKQLAAAASKPSTALRQPLVPTQSPSFFSPPKAVSSFAKVEMTKSSFTDAPSSSAKVSLASEACKPPVVLPPAAVTSSPTTEMWEEGYAAEEL